MLALAAPATAGEIPLAKPQEAADMVHRVTKCLVVSRPASLAQVLATTPGSEAELRSVQGLRSSASDCFGHILPNGALPWDQAFMSFQPAVTRGPIAEALLGRLRAIPDARRRRLDRPFDMIAAATGTGMSERTRATLIALDVADCVYRGSPAETLALFETAPGSSAEKAVVGKLGRLVPGCLNSGTEFKINHYHLRGVLAEAAYRQQMSASAGAANKP
jgi:hypothetical protein